MAKCANLIQTGPHTYVTATLQKTRRGRSDKPLHFLTIYRAGSHFLSSPLLTVAVLRLITHEYEAKQEKIH